MSKVIEVTDDSFEAEVLGTTVPVLVNVYGEHCGPCKLLEPVLAALAESLGGSAKVVTLDVAANGLVVADLNIAAVPTLIVFRGGKEVQRMVGLRDVARLREALAT